MAHNDVFSPVLELFDAGRFREANSAIHAAKVELQRANNPKYFVLLAELSYFLGDLGAAIRASERVLKDTTDPRMRALAHKVLADISANQLNFEGSLIQFSAARSCLLGQSYGDVRAIVELSHCGWFLGILPVESTDSEFTLVRRAVISNGRPTQFAELRFCAARLEARKGNLIEAERHWTMAARLLEQSHHAKLLSQLWLNGCMISVVRGDARTALEQVEKAAEHAKQSGYFRSIIGAQVNRAHILHSLGDLDLAKSIADQAIEASRNYPQLYVAALDCSANILVAQNQLSAAEEVLAEIGRHRPEPGTRLARHWDVLSELSSSVSLARAKAGSQEAAEFVAEGPKTAAHSRDTTSQVDDAVALLELGGYPHVLAQEAYALLELSGAVDATALVARGEQGIRCAATHGWSEAEARAAAEAPGDHFVIACGTHRDEAWEIIAALKPSLNDRCTAVAIRKLVDTAVTLDRYRREEKQRTALWPADTIETDGGLWVSEQMTELLSIARRIAPADVSVLLTGETGTGKEVLARAIHRASGRGSKPFIAFNCTAVPREMLESQLFGYRKGAFTGAHAAFDGVIRGAAGGTLFLDEIAEIGLDLQPKLLRFLETCEVHGLGEPHPVKVDVRVVAATNADPETLVAEGRFHEDLFYRLNVVRLHLPPLRERREEIPPLIDHYLRSYSEQQNKGRLSIDDEAMEYLVLYRWPGNVRQLVNEISRVVAYADPDSTITPAMLSPEVQASRRTVRVQPGDEPEIRVRLDQPLGDAVDAIERVMVIRALERASGNYENAARLLGISRKGLFLKRRRWGMQRQQAG